MTERLLVWFQGVKAGALEYDGRTNSFTFAYGGDYLASENALSISASLPLREQPYDAYASRKFFENLLPPEIVRRKLEMVLHVSVGNVFGCLKALGRDCAGAISLYPEGEVPDESGEEQLLELTDGEAEEAIRSLPQRPLLVGAHDGFRMSAAGAQDKIIARIRDGRLFLPLFGAASTDIVKPAASRLPGSVFNECFCQQLAAACGLNAATSRIVRFGDEICYHTIRFDRYEQAGRIRRWHQEDFCQILDLEPERKYQEEGGPSVFACFKALRDMRLGFAAQRMFLDYVIFNYLIGNADAHGKNFSILYRDGSVELSPLYDAMCTAVYDGASTHMAMRIGDAVSCEDVSRESFREMARRCSVNESFVLDELDRLAERIIPAAQSLAGRLSDEGHPSPVYAHIGEKLHEQVDRL